MKRSNKVRSKIVLVILGGVTFLIKLLFSTLQIIKQQAALLKKSRKPGKAGNSKVKYRHSATSSTAAWWERSPASGNATGFCLVNASGDAANGNNFGFHSNYSYGLAPAFNNL